MKKEVDINSLAFNDLPKEERIERMFAEGKLYNPFKVPDSIPMVNPFNFSVINGILEDGEHTFSNPFNCIVWRKALYKDGWAVKAWEDKDGEWSEIEIKEASESEIEKQKQAINKYWDESPKIKAARKHLLECLAEECYENYLKAKKEKQQEDE